MSKNVAAAIPRAKGKLEIIERAVPQPAAGEIVVRNHAVAINPADWKIQDYAFAISEYPNVLGSDIAGEVTAVGSGVTLFKEGDRVTGFAPSIGTNNPDHGALQTYTALPTTLCTKLPENLSYEDASTLPMQVATAGHCLFVVLGLPRISEKSASGQQEGILIWGGASSVGVGVIQLAKALGFTTYVTASPHNHAILKDLGADHLFDYKDADVVDKIVAAAKGAGQRIRYGVDAVVQGTPNSAGLSARVLDQTRGGEKAKLAISDLSWPQGVEQPSSVEVGSPIAFNMGYTDKETGAWLFNEWLTTALKQGTFKCGPPVERVGESLKDAQTALDILRKGVSGKKLVLPVP